MPPIPKAIRVRNAADWQDIALTGSPGPPGLSGPPGVAGAAGAIGKRTSLFASGLLTGPWPKGLDFYLPFYGAFTFRAWGACYAQYVGVNGVQFVWPGWQILGYGVYYFNEVSSHKICAGGGTVYGVGPGNGRIEIQNYGSSLSNNGDHGGIAIVHGEI